MYCADAKDDIKSVKDKSLLSCSTLYVNLEPCSHYGKTPPCADAIIAAGIPKIVIGNVDCNEKVCGKGIEKLRNAGCEVISNVLDKECEELNKRFFTYHKQQRPYIILKWAKSADGFIDINRKGLFEAPPARITGEKLRQLDHKWRTEEAAIMIGTNTALKDDPQLTARCWSGKNPVRIVLDRTLKLPKELKIFDNSTKTIIFNEKTNAFDSSSNNDFVKIEFDKNLISQICYYLRTVKIMSAIVEGGSKLLSTFINTGIWDEARVFTADKVLHEGVNSPNISGKVADTINFGTEKLEVFLNGRK